jgi:small subunit ribosomal protein S6
MRIYEVIFILKPDLPEEEIEQVVELVKTTITSDGGTIDKVDHWGKRKLAYRVQRHAEGYYVLVQYSLEGSAALAKEVERRLRVSDPVIKFLTVRVDEDLKRAEKLKAKRDKRAARKPSQRSAPAAPPPPGKPASESTPTPAEPGAAEG